MAQQPSSGTIRRQRLHSGGLAPLSYVAPRLPHHTSFWRPTSQTACPQQKVAGVRLILMHDMQRSFCFRCVDVLGGLGLLSWKLALMRWEPCAQHMRWFQFSCKKIHLIVPALLVNEGHQLSIGWFMRRFLLEGGCQ